MHATPVASPLSAPTFSLLVGDMSRELTMSSVPGSNLFGLNVDVRTRDFSLTGSSTVNQDPWIDYGFAFKNLSAIDMSFTLVLETPFVGGPYPYATSSHSGSVTDSGGALPANGKVTVSSDLGAIHMPYVEGPGGFVPFGTITGGCTATGTPGASFACGQQTIPGISVVTGNTGTLRLVLSGTVSPGDVYTFNGLASISNIPNDTVPEPTTISMALVAFGAAALIRRRIMA